MISFAVFDDDGRYLYKTQTIDQMGLAHQRRDRIFVGEVDIKSHYQDLDTGLPVAMPAQPSPAHQFDWATKAWFDPRTLADHQAARWAAIKDARDAAMHASLVTPCGVFDADAESQARLDREVRRSPLDAVIRWTLADNTVVSLTPAYLDQINQMLGYREQRARAVATQLREQIDAATTPEAVAAVAWPEDFKE